MEVGGSKSAANCCESTYVFYVGYTRRSLFWAEFLKVIQSKGSGWVDYMFPKPGQSQPSQKWSYIKAINIDGTRGFVGAGFYPQ